MGKDLGITVRKSEDLSEWYTQAVTKAGLADYAPMKGFIVLMPYGYSIWERIRAFMDAELEKLGHKNAYFPALIPESLLRKEAEHFSGFVPEVLWVTQAGDRQLNERLAVRPTSETIIYASVSKWIKSWRDLPLLLNVWNSVMRAEIKSTKPFIRTTEFLWQEGHTIHETKEEAEREVFLILGIYKRLMEEVLAIPVISGYKSESEKFVGALYTTTLEAIMPDGKALQMGTSHNMGQNFSIPFEIKYLGRDEREHFAWTTSWGISWRLIGAVVMVHGDDKGLILPPRIAPIQVVIVPIFYSDEERERALRRGRELLEELKANGIRAHLDDRTQYTPGWKFNEWELKGVPLRAEIGPRNLREGTVTLSRRDSGGKEDVVERDAARRAGELLEEIQGALFERAKAMLESMTHVAKDFSELKAIIEGRGGFVKACWCGSPECESKIKEQTGATIRAIPFEREEPFSGCVWCGREAKGPVYFARAY